MVASSIRPRSRPSARSSSITARKPERAWDDSSISTYEGCLPGSGSRQPAPRRSTSSIPSRSISSKLVTPPAVRSVGKSEQLEGCLRRGHADEGRLDRVRARHQAQHRGGDHAERSLGADEQVLEIVAGIVLLELVEVVQHASVGKHHFDAERMRARNAMGKRGGAAGIGREIAADGAGPLRRQQLRIEPVHACRRLTRPQQRDAGLAGHGVGNGIDLANAIEAVEREHDLAVLRDLPADEAGIAALRNDGRGRFVRELEDVGDLRHRARPQHDRGVAAEHVAHLQEIGRLRLRIGDGVLVAHDRNEAGQEIGRQKLGGGRDDIHHAGSLGWTRPDYSASSNGIPTSCARGGRPCETVIDRFAQARVRDRHHRDGGGACGIERAQVGEQVGGGFDQIAARR